MGLNIIEKHAGTIRRMAHTRDTFQTFVFRSMAVCTFIILSAWSIWVYLRNGDSGCKGVLFTVQGHYSNAEWMELMFDTFRTEIANGEYDDIQPDDVCLELIIGEDVLGSTEPAVWNPHHIYWVRLAKEEFGEDLNATCFDTAKIPMGIAIWSSLADTLGLMPDNSVIGLAQLNAMVLGLIQQSTGPNGEGFLDTFLSLSLAHGHPNVTTGGLLYLVDALVSLGGSVNSEDDNSDGFLMAALENLVVGYAPNDINPLLDMVKNGPDYVKATISFENLVIKANRQFSRVLSQYDDDLKFLYLNQTFWVSHPMCDMTGSRWVEEGSKQSKLALYYFLHVNRTTNADTLMQYGLRPIPAKYDSSILNTTIWDSSNGVDSTITAAMAMDLEDNNKQVRQVSADNLHEIMYAFAEVQKPAFLHIILDISGDMLTTTSSTSDTRWGVLSGALDVFYENMIDRSLVHVSCMAGSNEERYFQVACDSAYDTVTLYPESTREVDDIDDGRLLGYHPKDNLQVERSNLRNLISSIGPQSGQTTVMPMAVTQLMYDLTRNWKSKMYHNFTTCVESFSTTATTDEVLQTLFSQCTLYNFRLLVISQNERDGGTREEQGYSDIISELKEDFTSNRTQVFNILFWDSSEGTTGQRMDNVSTYSGARFYTDSNDIRDTLERLIFYF